MLLNGSKKIRRVLGLTDSEIKAIKNHIQGAVYIWCKNQPDQQFAARDLFGGVNFDWTDTALKPLYNKHIKLKKHEGAIKAAGKDLGWLLKLVLSEDKRGFYIGDAGKANGYTWDGQGP